MRVTPQTVYHRANEPLTAKCHLELIHLQPPVHDCVKIQGKSISSIKLISCFFFLVVIMEKKKTKKLGLKPEKKNSTKVRQMQKITKQSDWAYF